MRTIGLIVTWIVACFATAFLVRKFLQAMSKKAMSNHSSSKGDVSEWKKGTQSGQEFLWKQVDGQYWVKIGEKESQTGPTSMSVEEFVNGYAAMKAS